MKNTLVQACHDPNAWPFARIARSAAAWNPDLVLHVGDYFYRDSPCPAGNAACAGNPWGDTWAAAQADFFAPAEPLLQAAPWIFVRGNHEGCQRTGNAWFRLLDPRPLPQECTDQTEPYTVPIGARTLFVLDTTTAHDLRAVPETVTYFATQLAALAENRPVWLLSHKPFWAFGTRGQAQGGEVLFRTNPTLQAAVRQGLPDGIELVLSGHLHTTEFLTFAQGKPHQFVVGNGGTLLDPPLATELVGLDIADRTVSQAETLTGFGYVTLERGEEGWTITPRDTAGLPRPCRFRSTGMSCAPQN
jgi:predicted phosphodiesterase